MSRFAIWALLISLGSASANAETVADARADEAVTIFEKYCVVNGGTRDQAVNVIGPSSIAKPLPESVVTELQSGRKGGIGWLVATPHDGRLILAYDPIGVCEVAVVSADGDSMRHAFQTMIDKARDQLKVQVSQGEPQISKVQGQEIAATPYSFPFLGKTATLTLTTAERTMPIGFQHTMTSTFTSQQR